MKKRVLYANANYEEIVRENGYFVDKTAYIEKLESVENPVFLRPRRFGKSLWCRILECYYNINQKDDFDRLFGHTWIGQSPTRLRNSFFVLHLDFSIVEPTGNITEIEKRFNHICNLCIDTMLGQSATWFPDQINTDFKESASANLERVLKLIRKNNLPALYVIIDEYDNFANQLLVAHKDYLYRELTRDDSFLKTFYELRR